MCALLKVMRRSYSLEPHITTYLWYGSAIGKVTSTMPMFYFTTTHVIIKYDLRTCRDEVILEHTQVNLHICHRTSTLSPVHSIMSHSPVRTLKIANIVLGTLASIVPM
jgi:hypothetical protein